MLLAKSLCLVAMAAQSKLALSLCWRGGISIPASIVMHLKLHFISHSFTSHCVLLLINDWEAVLCDMKLLCLPPSLAMFLISFCLPSCYWKPCLERPTHQNCTGLNSVCNFRTVSSGSLMCRQSWLFQRC